MLRKLLKYDLKAIFKFWWIAAIVTVLASVFGGFCDNILNTYEGDAWSVYLMMSMGSLSGTFLNLALPVVTFVLIFIRFYKNFFTDEGYLTFTLPVSRRKLMLSKIISGTTALCSALTVCLSSSILRDIIASYNIEQSTDTPIKSPETYEVIYYLIYALEAAIAALLAVLCTLLFLYACITFASMIVRKGKVIAAIGISWVAFSIVSFLLQAFLLVGIFAIMTWLAPLPAKECYLIVALMGFAGILLLGAFCCIFYILQQLMLERRLNLS